MVVLLVLSLTGCLYSNISVPLDTDLDRTKLGSKVGRSRAHNVMFLVSWGDAGTQAAAEDGQIQVLTHADRELFLILFGLYGRQTTVVYGE
jgi:hypothetical protein